MKPTEEQIKWFWEQCGFKYFGKAVNFNYGDTVEAEQDLWEWPDGNKYFALPGISSLDNLFKYAVSKIPHYVINFYPTKVNPTDAYTTWYVVVGKRCSEGIHREDKDPALALFWAIYRCFENE